MTYGQVVVKALLWSLVYALLAGAVYSAFSWIGIPPDQASRVAVSLMFFLLGAKTQELFTLYKKQASKKQTETTTTQTS